MREINIYVKPSLSLAIRKSWFKQMTQKILDFLNAPDPLEIGFAITNNTEIKRLNKKYRSNNCPTDVLAFSMDDAEIEEANWINLTEPPDDIFHLGEVVISYPQAVLQANENNHTIKRELQILMVHGILHLLGYDHELSSDKARAMREKERNLLKMLSSEPVE